MTEIHTNILEDEYPDGCGPIKEYRAATRLKVRKKIIDRMGVSKHLEAPYTGPPYLRRKNYGIL